MKELKIFLIKIRPIIPLTEENKSAQKVKLFSPINSPRQSHHNPPPALSLPSPP